MKIKMFIISLIVLSFTAGISFAEKSTMTYYNNKVPYKALFQQHDTNLINIQVNTKRGKVQANIPVVNDVKKDLTQKKGK